LPRWKSERRVKTKPPSGGFVLERIDASFIHAVSVYNKEFGVVWNPNEIVLKSQHITILYSYWDFDLDDEVEEYFDLDADHRNGFVAGELLFKVHNQVVEKLENEMHQFFEGFLLGKRKYYKDPHRLLYFINQGK
jgi:hypothetical protein